jgi:tetratricopeptide (TPR) repeat protein
MHNTPKTGFTIIFVLFMNLSTSAWAENVQADYDLDALAHEAEDYKMAASLFKTGNYREALDAFEKVMAEKPSDGRAFYHAGISALMLNDYRKAKNYLERSSEITPTVKTNAYYYAGICDYKLSDYGAAIEKFDYVFTHAETQSLKKDADMWLQLIKSEKARQKPYALYAKAGLQYDDNVTLTAVNSDIVSDESDMAAIGFFTGRYAFVKQDQFDVGAGYSHYQAVYQDLSEYDLTEALPELYTKYRISQITFGLSYMPSYYWVDADSYLMQHQINPEVRWQVNDYNEAALAYNYLRNNYFTGNQKDGHANEIGVDLYHAFANMKGYLFCSGSYMDNTASGKDEYYTEASATLGGSYNLSDKTNLILYGSYFDKHYDYTDRIYNKKRYDSKWFAYVSINQQVLYDWLKLSAEYTCTQNDSNISEYEYTRNTIALYIAADF